MWRDRRGNVALITALLLPVFLGMIGLGVEVSHWSVVEMELQRTTDIAALAAGRVLNSTGNAYTATTAALNLAEINGIAASTRSWNASAGTLSGTRVTAQLVSGIRNPADSAIKVTAQRGVPLFLVALFLKNGSVTISASGWAELIQVATGTPQPCIVGLARLPSPSQSHIVGVSVSGGAQLSAGNCAIRANADISVSGSGQIASSAVYSGGDIDVQGGSSRITASSGVFAGGNINVSGSGWITAATSSASNTNVSGNGGITGNAHVGGVLTNSYSTSPTLLPGNPGTPGQIADPYAGNTMVQSAFVQVAASGSNKGAINLGWTATNQTLQPGTYTSITLADWGPTVTFAPGVYYVNGNVNLSGGTIAGSGVTIITSGQFTVSNGVSVTLSAPLANATSGIPGMLVAGTTGNAFSIGGGATASLAGVIYFPNAAVSVSGGVSASSAGCLEVIAYTIAVSSGASVGGNCASFGATSFSGTAPATTVALVQ
nr:TadE/TadG family type IV pilus assembly protein [uncultured Rhodopila sp.]